jgi:hypothetical protein
MSTAGNTISDLILRSDPQDRVSKDGGAFGVCGHPSRLAESAFTRIFDALWLAPQDEA